MFRNNDTSTGLVTMPDPAVIDNKPVREALERYIIVTERRGAAFRARDAAIDARTNSANDAASKLADELFDDPSAEMLDPARLAREADANVKAAQAELDAMVVLKRRLYDALRETIAEQGSEWRLEMRAKADKAVSTLTTAVRMAEKARLELADAMGVLILIDTNTKSLAQGGGAVAYVGVGRYQYALDQALPPLRDALTEASREVSGL